VPRMPSPLVRRVYDPIAEQVWLVEELDTGSPTGGPSTRSLVFTSMSSVRRLRPVPPGRWRELPDGALVALVYRT
jgi:hypothetical protein